MTDVAALGLSIDSNGVVKASADLDKFAASSDKAAEGAAKVGSASSNTTSSTVKMAQGIAAAQSKIDAATSSTFRLAEGFDALTGKANGSFMAIGRNLQSIGAVPAKFDAISKSIKLTARDGLNLSRQFSDIGVTAAMGMNPLMIALQQGPQLLDIFQEKAIATGTTIGAVMRAVGAQVYAAIAPLLPIIAAIGVAVGAVASAFALGARNINKANGDIAAGLGLTEKQLKKVEKAGVSTAVTIGDTFFAFFDVVGDRLLSAFEGPLKWLSQAWSDAMDFITKYGAIAIKTIVGGFLGLSYGIQASWRLLPGALGDIFMQIVNNTIDGIETLINKVIGGINFLIKAANAAIGTSLDPLGDVNLGQFENKFAGQGAAFGQAFSDGFSKGMTEGGQVVDRFFDDVSKRAAAIRKAAILAAAGDADKTPKGPKTEAEKFADLIAGMSREIALTEAKTKAVGLGADAALRMENQQKALNDAQAKGIHLTDQQRIVLLGLSDQLTAAQIKLKNAEGFDDLNKGIDKQIRSLDQARAQIGVYGESLYSLVAFQGLYNEALEKELTLNEAQIKVLADKAKVAGAAAAANDASKFLEDTKVQHEATMRALTQEREEIALGGAALETYRYEQDLINQAMQAHVTLTPDVVASIHARAVAYGEERDSVTKAATATQDMLDLLDSAADRTNQAAQGMADAFGSVGDAIGKLATQFADYGATRARIDEEIRQAEKSQDFAKAADLREKAQANQIDNYRMLAGTAKTFFKEGSTGYKTLAAAEKAFAVVQLANTAVNIAAGAAKMFASLGPFAFPAVAAMIAIMAGLGFASRGGSGKAPASAEQVQAAQGTGTVLGDPTGKSESIARALDIVADNTNNMLEYDNSMLRSLRSIDDNIGALTSQLAKQLGAGGAFDTGNLGLGTNTSGGLLGGFPVVGAVLGALFGKTTTTKSLFDQGLQFNPQMLADAIANGIAGSTYQIVETVKKKSGFLGLGSSTKTSYQTTNGALDSDMQKQVGLILGSLRDSVVGAAKIIGLDVADALNAFQVEIGKISFKDMSSSEIEAALQAAFSKVGDQMAGFAVDGLEAFQQAGEGLFETLIRLAKDYQTIDVTLKSIGKTFGAVGASSIAARESLIALFGTLDDFVEATSFYQQNFLTPAQQIGPVQQQVQSTLAGLGLSGVDTIAEFKAVVDGIDLTTEAGQQLYASMMQLAPAFYAVEQYQQQQAQVAADLAKQKAQLEIQLLQAQGKTAEAQARQRQLELAAADASLRPLMQQIYAAQDAATAAAAKAEALTGAKDALSKAYETESAAIQQTADKMRDLGDSLRDFRASLTSDELTANPAALAAKFREVGRMASLGDQTAMGNLPQVAKDYLDSVRANATSEQEYMRALAEVKRYTDSAIGAADQGVSVAEQQLEALKTQVGALIDINDSVLTVEQAILNLTALPNPASPTPVTPITPVTQEQQDREDEREQRRQDREDERQKRVEDALARLKIQNDDTKRMWNQILAGVLPITVRTDPIEPLEVVTP